MIGIECNNTMLPKGTVLQAGKYRIEEYLASGGFGNTYLSINNFDEEVAIKEFFMKDVNQRASDSTTVSVSNVIQTSVFQEQKMKFKKEAQRLHELKSPHIVYVSDMFDENGTSYYVMDYIDGQSLRDMVKQQGKLTEQEAIGYLNQALDALEEVHRQKMFHLDIKPANLMVDRNGQIWLIDFGASKQQKTEGGATSRSAICYSPGYAPIEQKDQEFKNFGPWTDLYALGATLYNSLTGQVPPSTNIILDEGEKAFVFPISVSERMQNLIIWMMKGRRGDRPQSVADVRIYLNEGQKSHPKPHPYPKREDDYGTILNDPIPEPKPEPKQRSDSDFHIHSWNSDTTTKNKKYNKKTILKYFNVIFLAGFLFSFISAFSVQSDTLLFVSIALLLITLVVDVVFIIFWLFKFKNRGTAIVAYLNIILLFYTAIVPVVLYVFSTMYLGAEIWNPIFICSWSSLALLFFVIVFLDLKYYMMWRNGRITVPVTKG